MKEIAKLFVEKIAHMNLPLNLIEVNELDGIYQVILAGGNNGFYDWPKYLTNIAQLMRSIDCWLIKLENDVLDDIHYVTIGVEK